MRKARERSHLDLLALTGVLSLGMFAIASLVPGQESPDGGIILPVPAGIQVDIHPFDGLSNLNGMLEPGETVFVEPTWANGWLASDSPSGTSSLFTGPPGGTYLLVDPFATYYIDPFTQSSCWDYQQNCYVMAVVIPPQRPSAHWDATFLETLNYTGYPQAGWVLHIGDSFPDVPTWNLYYISVEKIFHFGITGGCGGGNYCPSSPVTRAQMAALVLKAKNGSSYAPPPCTGTVFLDVPCTGGLFDPWIEDLAAQGFADDCGGGNYCPNAPATRQQVAVPLLKATQGAGYTPPPAAGIFGDVPQDDPSAPWIEDLYTRGITAGCSSAPLLYCPANPIMRGQMAVFLVKTFSLVIN